MITVFAVNAVQGNGEMKMAKFEEEVDKVAKQVGYESLSLLIGDCEEANKIYIHFKNWHSDEEFQEMKESYWNQAESILSMLDEIKSLKSQLQQQALPVVPECVAKTVELLKKNPESSWSKLYSSLGEEGVTWLNDFQHKDERFGFGELNNKLFVLFHLAINGYTVEKPQLFEVKMPIVYWNDDASQLTNGFDFLRIDKETDEVDFVGFLSNTKKHTVHFTEEEIKSIDERYWQFAVPVEDGE